MPAPKYDRALRDHVLYLLRGGGAHVAFDKAVADFPAQLRGARPKGAPHSAWELLEHMRIAQWDILEFSRNPGCQELEWPAAYWPPSPWRCCAGCWAPEGPAWRPGADLEVRPTRPGLIFWGR